MVLVKDFAQIYFVVLKYCDFHSHYFVVLCLILLKKLKQLVCCDRTTMSKGMCQDSTIGTAYSDINWSIT
jgi:hypothetical protein